VSSARALSGGLRHYRLVTMIDISRQKHSEQSAQDQYRTIAELSNTVIDQALNLRSANQELERRVRERTRELHEANRDTILMLAMASEAKDEDTGRHLRRIRRLSYLIARSLGLDETEADRIGYSSVLHDVGKMHVPDEILKKPGPLEPHERRLIEEHTIIGERILGENPFFACARRICRSHHENWDGSGYPDGLAGERVPLEARIVHLADVFDALTNPRVYKRAWTRRDTIEEIRVGRGVMFDPRVLDAFEALLRDSPRELDDPRD